MALNCKAQRLIVISPMVDARARRVAEERYAIDRIAEQYEALYTQILAARR